MEASSNFEIQETRRRGWARLSVRGELDLATALTFRRRLRSLQAAHIHVCVDLSELEFMDSSGVHELEQAVADSRQTSWCVEVEQNMSDQAKSVLDLVASAR